MTRAESSGSAAHARQQRSQSPCAQLASRGGTDRPRGERSLRSSLLLLLQPTAPARRASSYPAASSSRPTSNIEARRCMLLRCMSRAHEIRRHQVHAMLWDGRQEGLAAAREWPLRLPRRMVPKMRVDRAPSTFVSFFLFSLAFRTKRVRMLTATALPDRTRTFSCARTDVVAVHNFLSAHVEQCAQPPALHPRRSDADPTAVTSFVRSRTPWCGPSLLYSGVKICLIYVWSTCHCHVC